MLGVIIATILFPSVRYACGIETGDGCEMYLAQVSRYVGPLPRLRRDVDIVDDQVFVMVPQQVFSQQSTFRDPPEIMEVQRP